MMQTVTRRQLLAITEAIWSKTHANVHKNVFRRTQRYRSTVRRRLLSALYRI